MSRLTRGSEAECFVPDGWKFKGSLSQRFRVQATEDMERRNRGERS